MLSFSQFKVTHNPKPTEDEISFILTEIKNYLNADVEVRRGDVLSAWSGIRPLVSDPNKEDTQSLARYDSSSLLSRYVCVCVPLFSALSSLCEMSFHSNLYFHFISLKFPLWQ